MEAIQEHIQDHPRAITGVILIAVGLVLSSDQALQFIWKHFAGPVVADARNVADVTYMGVSAAPGYNSINTTVYAVMAGLAVFGLERLIKRLDIGTDERFVLALTPFIVLGGLTRTMTDAGIIPYPVNIAFITPLIYFLIFAITIFSLLGSLKLAERYGRSYYQYLAGIGTVLCICAIVTLGQYIWTHGASAYTGHLIIIPLFIITIGLTIQFGLAQWRPETFLASPVGAIAVTAHSLDGASTAVGMTWLNYAEKHVVADFVIQTFGTPFAFTALKMVFILGVLGLITKETEDRRFTLLVMLGIIAVALGPGIRNITRAILGV